MQDNIQFNTQNGFGIITLNRPQVLNALNVNMIRALRQQLQHWAQDKAILSILIQSATPRVFSAGGDIRDAYEARQKGIQNIEQYFKEEYELNEFIKEYPKPYIAFLDGLTLGGGAGISLHGSLRIATEHFNFGMPETGIGFFPDVGANFFLSRTPGEIGTYLALTSARINAREALYAGLIDIAVSPVSPDNHLEKYREIIDTCFKFNTVEEILTALEKENNPWTNHIISILKQKSPTSLKLTLKLLRIAKHQNFSECIKANYTLACYFVRSHDFYEGIRAAIIDKDKTPHWRPDSLETVDMKILDLL